MRTKLATHETMSYKLHPNLKGTKGVWAGNLPSAYTRNGATKQTHTKKMVTKESSLET